MTDKKYFEDALTYMDEAANEIARLRREGKDEAAWLQFSELHGKIYRVLEACLVKSMDTRTTREFLDKHESN